MPYTAGRLRTGQRIQIPLFSAALTVDILEIETLTQHTLEGSRVEVSLTTASDNSPLRERLPEAVPHDAEACRSAYLPTLQQPRGLEPGIGRAEKSGAGSGVSRAQEHKELPPGRARGLPGMLRGVNRAAGVNVVHPEQGSNCRVVEEGVVGPQGVGWDRRLTQESPAGRSVDAVVLICCTERADGIFSVKLGASFGGLLLTTLSKCSCRENHPSHLLPPLLP
jgi:hypothetical protein